MEKYTRNRTYFEQFAPRGLILHSHYYHAYIYYRDGQYRFLDDCYTPSFTHKPPGEEILSGGWSMLTNSSRLRELTVYRYPTTHIYRR